MRFFAQLFSPMRFMSVSILTLRQCLHYYLAIRLQFKRAGDSQTIWSYREKRHLALVVSSIEPYLPNYGQNGSFYFCIYSRYDRPFWGFADDLCGFNNNTNSSRF